MPISLSLSGVLTSQHPGRGGREAHLLLSALLCCPFAAALLSVVAEEPEGHVRMSWRSRNVLERA